MNVEWSKINGYVRIPNMTTNYKWRHKKPKWRKMRPFHQNSHLKWYHEIYPCCMLHIHSIFSYFCSASAHLNCNTFLFSIFDVIDKKIYKIYYKLDPITGVTVQWWQHFYSFWLLSDVMIAFNIQFCSWVRVYLFPVVCVCARLSKVEESNKPIENHHL